jgi:hypothetical protein
MTVWMCSSVGMMLTGENRCNGEKPVQGSLFKLHLWNELRSCKINRVLWVTKLFWSCVLGDMCHVPLLLGQVFRQAGVLTNASSDVCPPAHPLPYSAGVCTIDVTQILAPMLLQIYDTNCARECNEARCSTIGFEANGANRTEKNNRMAKSPPHDHFACSYMTNDTRKRHLQSTECIVWFRKVRYHGLWRHSFALVYLK